MSETNLGDFGRRVDLEVDQIIGQFVEFHKMVAQKVFQMLVTDSRTVGIQFGSPVWSGRYRGSFTIAINRVDTSHLPPNPNAKRWPIPVSEPYSPLTAADVRRHVEGLKLGDTIYIANTVPYVRRIEFGHSKLKAPNGVFEVTVAKAEALLGAQAEQIARVVNTGLG